VSLIFGTAFSCRRVARISLVFWNTGILPPFLTSLIFFGLVLTAGLVLPDKIFSGFGSAAVCLIISGFIIGRYLSWQMLGWI
jgi:hypothetical protein